MIQSSEAVEVAAQITWSARAQVGAVLVIGTLALLPLLWMAVRRMVPGRNIVFVRWGFSHVGQVLLLVVALGAALPLVGPVPGEDLITDLLVYGVLPQTCAVLLLVSIAVRLDPEGWRSLGVWGGGQLRAIGAALLAYVVALPGLLGVALVWVWFLEWTGVGYEAQDLVPRFAALEPGERLVPVLIGTALIPLCEELLFRAFLQPLLVQNLRDKIGIAVTSLVFAALHGVGALLPIFALSCLLGAIMLRTQRVAATWAVHALHNGMMFAVLFAYPEIAGMGGGA